MIVLAAPDKFRGTLTAPQAARSIAAGWRRERPDDEIVELPMADGGEGTLDTLVEALGGNLGTVRVTGPLGDPVDAAFGLVDRPEGRLGVVEMARASGLALVSRRDPLRASTYGTGELIREAVGVGARTILVCIGGSASTDGGAGMAEALGAHLTDGRGRKIPPGGLGLLDLARIDLTPIEAVMRSVRVVVASDVDSPLTGPKGSAHVFAPQKGASPEDVLLLDRALGHLAAVIHRDLGADVRGLPGAGAAGGLGAGLVAFLGARIRPGVEVVMEAVGFRERLALADVALTGEGRLDSSSLAGKVVGGVLEAAREVRTPAAVLCGDAEVRPDGVAVFSLVERFGAARALGETRLALEELAAEVATRASTLEFPP
ncbi:MAG TPA: glycerate kinase [Actinomycetota bacterium]|nr:glycerate kinase [Actinomycetota bacterium]